MSIVIALIVFGVGIYAAFVTLGAIPTKTPAGGTTSTSAIQNSTYYAVRNITASTTSVFNVVGIVLLISAIMLIVAVVYSYIRR